MVWRNHSRSRYQGSGRRNQLARPPFKVLHCPLLSYFSAQEGWRLKTTHWFRMHTHYQQHLQLDENITEAAWLSKKGWLKIADQVILTQGVEAEFAKDL